MKSGLATSTYLFFFLYPAYGRQRNSQPILIVARIPTKFCSVRQNLPKNKLFLCGLLAPFTSKSSQIWDHFFLVLFPKDSKSLKFLDIRLWEVGSKRRLNGTSKVNRRTDGRTEKRTNGWTDGRTDGHRDGHPCV